MRLETEPRGDPITLQLNTEFREGSGGTQGTTKEMQPQRQRKLAEKTANLAIALHLEAMKIR